MGYWLRYLVLIGVVGSSIATDDIRESTLPQSDGLTKQKFDRKNEAEDQNEVTWSSQSSPIDLAPKDIDINKPLTDTLQKVGPKSLNDKPISDLYPGMKYTPPLKNTSTFIPRRETTSHSRRRRRESGESSSSSSSESSSSSSSSSSSEDEEDHKKKKDSHKKHRHGRRHGGYPSSSFNRGTQSPHHEKRFHGQVRGNHGYKTEQYPNRYEHQSQYPGKYGLDHQYKGHLGGSRRQYMGNEEYQNFNKQPYGPSYLGQPAGL